MKDLVVKFTWDQPHTFANFIAINILSGSNENFRQRDIPNLISIAVLCSEPRNLDRRKSSIK
jgi:hypothetical protein